MENWQKGLVPEFEETVQVVLDECSRQGFVMRPYCGLRTPYEQAKLWRQSRSTQEIQLQINKLKSHGCDFLAKCLEDVGPQYGPYITAALPGFSWHQWGEAVDCFWLLGFQAEWVKREGYWHYSRIAEKHGLTSGGKFRFKDWPHIQNREFSPIALYSQEEINYIMERKFK